MKGKTFTHGITIVTTAEMYEKTKKISDERRISISDFLRGLIENYLKQRDDESQISVQAPESTNQDQTR